VKKREIPEANGGSEAREEDELTDEAREQ